MAVIYLDNNATTKPHSEVVEAMTTFMSSRYWNSSSAYGQLDGLEEVVNETKTAIWNLIDAASGDDDEIVFTSGATEANSWAVAEGGIRSKDGGYILASHIEHPSVREPFEKLADQRAGVRWAPVTQDGRLDLDALREIVTPDLKFASLMLAHNETGIIQPIQEAAHLIRECAPECLIHVDATQALGKINISVSSDFTEVDLISFSGHKFHGPKGIGGLIIRNNVEIEPMIRGGGQQNNLRSGTLNMPAICGLQIAARRNKEMLDKRNFSLVEKMRDLLEERILSKFPKSFFVGQGVCRLPNTSFFGIPGADGEDIVNELAVEGIVISKGSSCSSQSLMPSRSAMAMGLSFEQATSLVRVSLSFYTTYDEINEFVDKLFFVIGRRF